jgi:hypothetical protein
MNQAATNQSNASQKLTAASDNLDKVSTDLRNSTRNLLTEIQSINQAAQITNAHSGKS